jgi:hypothetical protein
MGSPGDTPRGNTHTKVVAPEAAGAWAQEPDLNSISVLLQSRRGRQGRDSADLCVPAFLSDCSRFATNATGEMAS